MNNDATPPGLDRQSTVRTAARVIAVVLAVTGVLLVVSGGSDFASSFDAPLGSPGDGPGSVLRLGAGGFCIVFAFAAANIGWLGAQASYVAGETMPVVKDSATYLSNGQGIAGIGRTAGAPVQQDAVGHGPYCRGCGTRNDGEAKFCDSCGQSLA